MLKPLLEAERNSEEPCQNSLRLGEVLLERANSVRLARRRVVSHSRHVTVANLVVAAPARIQRLSQLQEAFTQAISLNSDLPWQERRDAVRDVWQQMRSEYHALDVFVRHVGENELPRDARDVFAEMKDAMELVRQRETQLDESNIGYRKLDGRRVRGKNDEAMDDDEEEEEWEDIVDFEDEGMIEESDDDVRRVDEMLAREEASRTTTVTPSMNTPRPEVKDWVAVMKGAEGQNLNDSLLKKLEQSHAKRVGTASEHAEILTFGIDRTDAKSNGNRRGKGKGRGRGNSRGIEMSGTARDRLRKKLGIKKTKKKSLLDD